MRSSKPVRVANYAIDDGRSILVGRTWIRLWGVEVGCPKGHNGMHALYNFERLTARKPLLIDPVGVHRHGYVEAHLLRGRKNLGREMIRQGYAMATAPLYQEDELWAKANRLGLWRGDEPLPPPFWRRALITILLKALRVPATEWQAATAPRSSDPSAAIHIHRDQGHFAPRSIL